MTTTLQIGRQRNEHKDSELSPESASFREVPHLSFYGSGVSKPGVPNIGMGALENPVTLIQSTELGSNYFGNRQTADKSYTDVRRQTQFNSNFYALQWEIADLLFDVVGSLQCI